MKELVEDPKERAEHIMLVDLGRNDVGRVSKFGSVQYTDLLSIERYSHVMHLSSTVTGRLQPGKTAFDALRSCLPAGTLSGAPKIRAMQIIDELEDSRRSIYCGSLFYLDVRGELDSSIAIRTLLARNGWISCWGGGGIVADSDWEEEYRESITKVQTLLETLRAL